jgi:predicted 3-demethylubiquinone-9 3-methyltransferase (glyoxalase superfamily)
MKSITPCFLFNTQALEAAKFYTSIFPNSTLGAISHYGDGGHLPKGTVLCVGFSLNGQEYFAVNGGATSSFNESISLMVPCKTQAEIDSYWDKLTADGGQPVQCGWLKDKFGVCWQIVPENVNELLGTDPVRCQRVMQKVMTMVKLDMAEMQKAFDG